MSIIVNSAQQRSAPDLAAILQKRDSCKELLRKLEAGKIDPNASEDEKQKEEETLFLLTTKEEEEVAQYDQNQQNDEIAVVPAVRLHTGPAVEAACSRWTTDEVIAWLQSSFDFGSCTAGYVDNFREMGAEGHDLVSFLNDGEAILETMGVHTQMHRTKILDEISRIVHPR